MSTFIRVSDERILFFASIFFTIHLLFKSGDTAPVDLEGPAEGPTVERKSEVNVQPVVGSNHHD